MRQLGLFLVTALGATALTVDEAVAQGLASHDLLAGSNARVLAATGLRQQAALKPNPRLFLQSENSRVWGSPPFVYSRDADTFLYVSQVIETGGKRERRVDLAQAGVKRTEAEREVLRWQIANRIGVAYWNAAGASRYRQALAEVLSNLQRTVQYHRDRVREGAMAEADLLRMELEYGRVESALRTAAQEEDRLRMALFREMGIAEDPAVSFTTSLEQAPRAPEGSIEESLERRPDLAVFRMAREQAEANVALQQANAKTDPEFLGGYKRTNGFDAAIVGVQINLPIRNRNEGNIAAARAEIDAASATLRAAERAARTEWESARRVYESRARLATETLPALRARSSEIARIAEAAYREGGADILRLLDAERMRIDTDLQYFRALTDWQIAAVEWKTAQGAAP